MSTRHNRLYNYLVNQFGLTKEYILEYANKRIEDVLGKHIQAKLDSNYVEGLVLDRITKIVEEGIPVKNHFGIYYEREAFSKYVTTVVKQVMESRLNEEYDLEVKLIRKDRRVIASTK